MTPPHHILCLNAGSSSLKYALFRHADDATERVRGGVVEEVGPGRTCSMDDAVAHAIAELADDLQDGLSAAGHRVVHGGTRFTSPVRIDDDVLRHFRSLIPLAPEHQPGCIAAIEAVQRHDPDLPQVACFDTSYHRTMPELARRFPLPGRFFEAGVRRYGFHGLSYEHIANVLGPDIPQRTIIAHLGNGASMTALLHGRPIETTMGFTPNSGLVMGSRCGDLEPGVVLHLLRSEKLSPDELDDFLNHQCGLRGVSGLTSDLRTLLESAEQNEHAQRAIEMFCYSARKHLGALVAVLGGLDLLVFTGGIGEHSQTVRDQITEPLHTYLNFRTRVIPTDEEWIVARHTVELFGFAQDD